MRIERRSVYQYDLDGNFIRKFNSVKDAAENVETKVQCIYEAIDGKKTKLSKGFIWRSFKEKKIEVDLTQKRNRKKVYQYDLKGNYLRSFITMSEASKTLETSYQNIIGALEGKKAKTAKGFQWRTYKKIKIKELIKNHQPNTKPVIITKNGKEKRYISIKEASREERLNRSNLVRILKGKVKNPETKIRYADEKNEQKKK